jgi:transposase
LEEIFSRFPVLKEFWWTKEQLRLFYRAKDRTEGEKILGRILVGCESSDDAEMVRWGRTLRHWRSYLLNYFAHRTTNAYTEGVHTKIKLLKRASYGLRNIEVYVKKMLLGFLPPLLLYFHHTF